MSAYPQLYVATANGSPAFYVGYAPTVSPMAGGAPYRSILMPPQYEVRLDERPLDAHTARLLAAALVAVADEVDRLHAPRRRP